MDLIPCLGGHIPGGPVQGLNFKRGNPFLTRELNWVNSEKTTWKLEFDSNRSLASAGVRFLLKQSKIIELPLSSSDVKIVSFVLKLQINDISEQ